MLELIIGNRNYSSWSLRAWLYLRESGLPFDEIRVPLFTGDWRERVARYSPAGRVPVLVDGELVVWDTMAIFEHLLETREGAIGWPQDRAARALARSISAEMHSGFLALRDELPQNLRVRRCRERSDLSPTCRAQIERVQEIWSGCRARYGELGPWLFGELSIADVMFAPVALRFASYSVPVVGVGSQFTDAVLALDSVQEWLSLARDEPESLPFIDRLEPAAESPLVLG